MTGALRSGSRHADGDRLGVAVFATANRMLPALRAEAPGREAVSATGFQARAHCLDQRAHVVAVRLLLRYPAMGGDLGGVALAIGAAVGAATCGDRRSGRRNDDLRRRARRSRRPDRRVNRRAVVGAIGDHRTDASGSTRDQQAGHGGVRGVARGQIVGEDLAGTAVYGEVQLTPCSAFLAVLPPVPLAWAA